MRLEHIFVENFQGLASASLDLATPVTLVAGANGAGKSSLKEAIGLALGETARVEYKKDYGQLVTEGQKKSQIIITHDGVSSSFALPKGTVERTAVAGEEYLHFVLHPAAFASLDEKARRAMLFTLTKSSAKPEVVIQKLLERGVDAAKAEQIKPMLRSGFAAAHEAAKTHISDARGAWKAVTGEVYGSDKAEGWTTTIPEGPAVDDKVLEATSDEHKAVMAEIEKGVKFLGGLEEKRKASSTFDTRKAELTEAASLLDRAVAKRDTTQKDLEAWEPKLADMQAQLAASMAGAGGCDCPVCGATLKIVGNKLEKFEGAKADTKVNSDLALEISKAKDAVNLLRRTLQNDMSAVSTAEAAKVELDKLLASGVEAVSADKIKKTEDALTAQRLKADQIRAKFNALDELRMLIKNADKVTADAAKHHQDFKAWTLIANALAPDGIPAEILAGAIQLINASLAKSSAQSGWAKVQIGAEMAITAGGRLYGLLSESEKWRCDTLLALAIAQHSGLRLVVLDRFDVLDLPGRGQLLGMLVKMAQAGDIDSAVVLGTLKARPAKLPAEITSVWIEGGIAQGPEALQQTA